MNPADLASIADDIRARTPGVGAGVHLNAASAALPSAGVIAAMRAHLEHEGRAGLQAALAGAADALAETRVRAAQVLGARADQIAFGGGCAQLWATVLRGRTPPRGARVLVSRGEWGGNLLALAPLVQAHSLRVDVIPTDAAGRIDVRALTGKLDDDVWLVAIAAVSSASGLPQPVDAIGALPRPDHCLLVVDAAQAAGRFPLSLAAMGADVLVAPARKWLRGPRGQALAALSDAALACLAPPAPDLGGVTWSGGDAVPRADARRFEIYDYGVAARVGLGVALGELLAIGVDTVAGIVDARVRALRSALAGCDGVTVFEPADARAAFLTFTCDRAPAAVAAALGDAGVSIAAIERVYAPHELDARGMATVLRASPHAYTSPDEIERLAEALRTALRA
ncbi:aminotransferase class V-fold PLP-dependent enzyme [Bradyrhizobium sp. U87765 SZCCT0131]|uniref:aminotransferase class V-fold PLP-dependent enzyme n=1 Tax=unclassified Bradyrhizobium TaxID=2631580 RepID=UPI001BA6F914|nr:MULTISPECIES: aminotransferase class V-fold PLP-dependent enzyme [unclassified Bradyrhizobium]MBR1219560.1 aminotransferase class V-fold PLP-dependent enzyme [Bradyrhizobium sp. U87765 SZCCT0131]MBR1262211.1 aminotransferase class V-fold PLP-dependent enzyme [Bradyrhizobium sp. U87765 SZCCT0134]MBR1308606.1 aminotransferase class V-fold PLP-dependent enzyme [Bradyrhizobium sp. U87765 SZCCT0110]MBR1317993.1 aminotransferase class V-fold PLP-dependent enzyme [Bradyrhizobium sp. U87765 SZCCT010